jgi:hypothetical protein
MRCVLTDAWGNKRDIYLRPLEGRDEALVLAHPRSRASLVTDLLAQVSIPPDATSCVREQIATLTLGERDVLLARLRQENFGDQVESTATCPQCRERLDMDFSLEALLAHNRPQSTRGVVSQEDGWLSLANHAITFRLPTIADLEEMEQQAGLTTKEQRQWLIAQCVRPTPVPARLFARIERAMWRLSPQLSQELRARCAMCGLTFTAAFDVESFVLREIRLAARTLYRDVHLLARWYHWREEEILALPRQRRMQYIAELRSDLRGG